MSEPDRLPANPVGDRAREERADGAADGTPELDAALADWLPPSGGSGEPARRLANGAASP